VADSPFASLQVNNTIRSLESVSSTIDPADTSDAISLCVLRVCLADRVESGTTRIDLMGRVQRTSGTIRIRRTRFLDQSICRAMSKVVLQPLV